MRPLLIAALLATLPTHAAFADDNRAAALGESVNAKVIAWRRDIH